MILDPDHRAEDFIARDTQDGRVALDRRVLWGSSAAWITDDEWSRDRHAADRVALIGATLPGFIVVRDGAYLNERDADRVIIDSGHAALYNITRTPLTLSPWGNRRRSNAFYLQPRLVAEVLESVDPARSLDPYNPFPTKSTELTAATYLKVQALCTYLRRTPDPDPMYVDETVVEIVRELIARSAGPGRSTPDRVRQRERRVRDRVPEICAFLNAYPDERHTLSEIADRFSTSPYYLCRTFGQTAGLSLFRYLTRVRLRRSLNRILEGATSLTDVALDVGFSSHSHFTAAFRQEFGATPRSTRAKLSNRGQPPQRLADPTE